MINHEHAILALIDAESPQSYLEIGIGNGNFFNRVPIDDKFAVDPAMPNGLTSDEFFAKCKRKFDMIFIDGLHHAEQVERDIISAWKHTNPGGLILVHDICPEDEAMTIVPREQKVWTGDVYKAWLSFMRAYKDKIEITTRRDVKYGLGVIRKKGRVDIKPFLDGSINWMTYQGFMKFQPK